MNCDREGATHHLACDCREAAMSAEIARLTRERDEARERAESLSRELLAAIRARDSYRASAELRVGLRREFEALLGVSDTTAPETFEAGLARLRALFAGEAKAERLAKALRLAAKYAENCNPESGVVYFGVDSGVAEWQRDMAVVRAALAEVGE